MSELNNFLLDAYDEPEGDPDDERAKQERSGLRTAINGRVLQVAVPVALATGAGLGAYYLAEGGPKQAKADEVVCGHKDGLIKFDTDKPGCEANISKWDAMMQGFGLNGWTMFSSEGRVFFNGTNPPNPSSLIEVNPDLDLSSLNTIGESASLLIEGDPLLLLHKDIDNGKIDFSAEGGQVKGFVPIEGLTAFAEGNGRLYLKRKIENNTYIEVINASTIMSSTDGQEITNTTTVLINDVDVDSGPGTAIKGNTLITGESTGVSTFQLDENGVPIDEGSTYVDLGYGNGVSKIVPMDNGDVFFSGGDNASGARFTIERDGVYYDFIPGADFPEDGINDVQPLSGGRVLIIFWSSSPNIHIPPRIAQLSPEGEITAEPAINYPVSAQNGEVTYCAVIDPAFATCTETDPCEGMDCSTATVCVSGECEDGECVYTYNDGTDCDDGDNCTTGDICFDGDCTGAEVYCDDGFTCTADFCDADTGECETEPLTGPACDDGDPCTTPDTCENGTCTGTTVTCDDGVDCTSDSCVDGDCEHETHDDLCPEGPQCTVTACTLEGCTTTPISDVPCDDDNPDTTNDTCWNGVCEGDPIQIDENPEEEPDVVEPYYPDEDPDTADVVESPEEIIEEVLDATTETVDGTDGTGEDSTKDSGQDNSDPDSTPKPETSNPDKAPDSSNPDPENPEETPGEVTGEVGGGEDTATEGGGGKKGGGCSIMSGGPGSTPEETANSTRGKLALLLAAAGLWIGSRFRRQPNPARIKKNPKE